MKHLNNGSCAYCHEMMDAYEEMDFDLKRWFITFQALHPEAHISEAGRGRKRQEEMFSLGKSRAHFGQSAHNYNCAIDVFVNRKGLYIFDKHWFETVLAPAIPEWLKWYGRPGSEFQELPHIEVANWRELKEKDLVWLVEDSHES